MKAGKQTEKFSDDPRENLRIENDILKLKLQAQSGAFFEGDNEIPPEIENAFLQHVQAFEEAWKNVEQVKIFDLIGKPGFKKEKESGDGLVKKELKRLINLLRRHNIILNVLGNYEPRTIYRFITEEFLELEVNDLKLPGMTTNFIYEEFHPNHEISIRDKARDFLSAWLKKEFDENSFELGDRFIPGDGTIMSREQVLKKFSAVFESYTRFMDRGYVISEAVFEWNEEENKGFGHAAGKISYAGEMENGETIDIEGPFKLYMSNDDGNWSIYNFVFPGFSW